MSSTSFIRGQTYSRREIHNALGGSMQSYLPRRNGKIVCGCFKQTLNPTAPEIVLVGNRPNVIRDAKLFAQQIDPVPVFIKQQVYQWEYMGDYVVDHYSEDPAELGPLAAKAGRPHAVGILFLKAAQV